MVQAGCSCLPLDGYVRSRDVGKYCFHLPQVQVLSKLDDMFHDSIRPCEVKRSREQAGEWEGNSSSTSEPERAVEIQLGEVLIHVHSFG